MDTPKNRDPNRGIWLRYLIVFIVFCLVACKEDYCNGENFKFRARLELLMPYDDIVNINYTSLNSKNKMFKKVVKGKNKKQFIELCFAEVPKDFSISYSISNTKIEVFSLLLENQQRQKFITEDKIKFYFAPNKVLQHKNSKGISQYVLKDSTSNIRPTLLSRGQLKKILKTNLLNLND